MNRLDHILTMGTASLGLGGAVIAQSTQSPGITLGAIALSVIGLCSLGVRSHYQLATARLDVARITTELEVYRRLCARENTCPFTPTGEPACTLADVVDRRVGADRRRKKEPQCPQR